MKRRIALLLAVVLLLPCAAWAEALQVETWTPWTEALESAVEPSEAAQPLAVPERAQDAPEPNASKAETLKVSDKSSKTVYIGTTYQLVVSGKKIKSCKSSNSKVVKVSKSGLVTPIKAGTTKVTVTLKDGKKLKVSLKAKKKATTKELKGYFGKNLKKSAKKVGGLKAYTEKYEIYKIKGYRNKYVDMSSFEWSNGKIDTIQLLKKSKYTLFGIQVGMKKSKAQSKMAKRELISRYGDYESYWIDKIDAGAGTLLTIGYKSGKVNHVIYEWYGN